MSLLEGALALAAAGFRVMPLGAGTKLPRLKEWPDKATTFTPTIKAWWQTCPDANIGIATGRGLLVIDVDVKDDGFSGMDTLYDELGPLPETLTAGTASGGAHLYYSVSGPTRNSARKLAQGVDTRGDGGFVVAPPSALEAGGAYYWKAHVPVAPLPAAWLERITGGRDGGGQGEPFSLEPGELIPDGQRDNTLFRMACSLRSRGLTEQAIHAALSVENETRCRPPLPAADIRRIAHSAAKYEPGQAMAQAYVRHGEHRAAESSAAAATVIGGFSAIEPPEPVKRAELPRFPVECLPGPAALMVRAAASAVGVSVDMVAVPALVAMGAAIGGSRCVQVKRSWHEHASLWAAIVAPPSSGKSPAMKALFAPLRDWQAIRLKAFREQMERFVQDDEDWRGAKQNDRGDRPERPIAKRLIVDDFTMEQLAAILGDNPRGVVAVKDELASWVRSLNQYKGGRGADRANALALWSSGAVTVDRKLSPIPLHIELPIVSVIGGIQPEVLGELREHDDGFLERFLITHQPEVRASYWTDDDVDAGVALAWAGLIHRLLALDMAADEFGLRPQRIQFSAAGRDAYIAGYNAHRRATCDPELPPHLLGVWGKFEAYSARLALTLHCAQYVLGGPETIEADVARAAWTLCDYFKAHAAAAHGSVSSSSLDRRVDMLAAWLSRKGGAARLREITQNGIGGVKTNGEARALVERLVERGLGTAEEKSIAGGKRLEVQLHR